MSNCPKDPLRVWNQVWQTNPEYTKRVNQRGGFTAICASYKILKATRALGVPGVDWGWEEVRPPEIQDGVFLVSIRLWIDEGGLTRKGFPVYGTSVWDRNGKIDDDAPKKALTDAITKGLSYLGVCADVFLGKFDDHKYVQARREEARKESMRPKPEPAQRSQRAPGPQQLSPAEQSAHEVMAHMAHELDASPVHDKRERERIEDLRQHVRAVEERARTKQAKPTDPTYAELVSAGWDQEVAEDLCAVRSGALASIDTANVVSSIAVNRHGRDHVRQLWTDVGVQFDGETAPTGYQLRRFCVQVDLAKAPNHPDANGANEPAHAAELSRRVG